MLDFVDHVLQRLWVLYLLQKSVGFCFNQWLNYWSLILIVWKHGFRLLLSGSVVIFHLLDFSPWTWSLLRTRESSGVSTERLSGHQAPLMWWNLNSKLCFPSTEQLLKSLLVPVSCFFFPLISRTCTVQKSAKGLRGVYIQIFRPFLCDSVFSGIFSPQLPATLGAQTPTCDSSTQ